MTTSPLIANEPAREGRRWSAGKRPWMLGCAAAMVMLLVVGGWFVELHWPYRYRNVKPLLEEVFVSQVTIDKYHRTYFPRPGFVATGLTMRRKSDDPNLPPLATAKNLIVEGSWLDLLLLRQRVSRVDVDGLHVVLPAVGTKERSEDFPAGSSADFTGPDTALGKLSVRDGVLEVQRSEGDPVVFPVHKLIAHDVKKGQPLRFTLDMDNPMPSGKIVAKGELGPIPPNNLGATPVSGSFTYDQVKLSDIGSLRGTLKTSGDFKNTLDSIVVSAKIETPDFAVGQGHALAVSSDVACTVNSLNGDVILDRVNLRMGQTPVLITGGITGSPKTTRLEIVVARGRAQDLLTPFDKSRPPLAGPVALRAHGEILPGKPGATFLSRLQMDGFFDVPAGRLTDKQEEQSLSALSERMRAGTALKKDQAGAEDDAADVLSSLKGNTTIRNGVVHSDLLQFAVAGAHADFHGNFDLKSLQAHFDGTVYLDSDISHVTTGFKSDLLKPFAPFFKRKDVGAQVPVAITGGPGNYKIGSNLLHTK